MLTIVYDSGALLAAEHRNPDFLGLQDELTAAGIRHIVHVAVLEQGVEDEFLLDAVAAPPHRGGEFWGPRCRHRLAGE